MPEWGDAVEADVREDLITPLLQHLGYRRGTIMDIKREEKFQLAAPFMMIGRTKIAIDYVPKVRLKRFFIAETKSPKDPLNHETLLQATFYAMHPEVNARYVVTCNGRRLEVFRVGSEPYDKPILAVDQTTATGEDIRDLRELLGARTVAKVLRERTIEVLRETLEVEIDEQAVTDLDLRLRQMLQDSRTKVKRNANEVTVAAWKSMDEQIDRQMREATFDQYLIMIDIPTNANRKYGRELARRLIDAETKERGEMLDKLAMTWRSRVHGVFRVHCLTAMIHLLWKGVQCERTDYLRSIEAAIDELVSAANTYYEFSNLSCALVHLDNASMRVGYKIARKTGAELAAKQIQSQREVMAPLERLMDLRSAASSVLTMSNIISEYWLWRRFCSESNALRITEGVWDLELLEEFVDALPGGEYPQGDGSLMFFECYGRGVDMLRLGSWDVLHSSLDSIRTSTISEDTKEFASLEREDLLKTMPTSPARPSDWVIRDANIRGIRDGFAALGKDE